MPELSRFYRIVIKMYYNDHNPPHFHAEYGNDQMVVDVNTLGVIGGRLAPRATGLVMEWAAQHQAELQHKHGSRRETCSHLIASIRCRNGQLGPASNQTVHPSPRKHVA